MKHHKKALSAKFQMKLKISEQIKVVRFSGLLSILTWEKDLVAD